MAAFSRVTTSGWTQGDDTTASSRVTPGGWEQVVAVVAVGGSTITAAAGTSTASTVTGSSTAASAPTAAAGTSVAGTLVGSSITAGSSTITPAAGTSAAGTLAGTSTAASTITGAAGASAAGTLTGLSTVMALFTPAAGTSVTGTLAPPAAGTVGRPTSDASIGTWLPLTGSTLWPMLDEVVPDAADYIYATSTGAICEVNLNATAYPGTASQQLKFRASSSTGNSVIVRLKEGATTIKTLTQVLTATDTEYTMTLSAGEIAAITSGSLSVELESA